MCHSTQLVIVASRRIYVFIFKMEVKVSIVTQKQTILDDIVKRRYNPHNGLRRL